MFANAPEGVHVPGTPMTKVEVAPHVNRLDDANRIYQVIDKVDGLLIRKRAGKGYDEHLIDA